MRMQTRQKLEMKQRLVLFSFRYRIKDVCCPDYEKRENDCIACSKGYTSYIGQNCKPCSKNTYGERCRFECSCLDFQVGTIKKVCCADFEEKGKGCIACSKGYTSLMGQNCRPCPNNTYGEKCRYDCSCSRFEMYAFLVYVCADFIKHRKQHIVEGDSS
ncbi:unnamed protein product [Mytilus coruscus]|uniref:MEGF10_11 n=1 Tax=Mytilus coruscus TaxID=42192 RepID=A0A6J8ECZ8_MYTCO|nr:unnamed protein product [Mytilus coruscus]